MTDREPPRWLERTRTRVVEWFAARHLAVGAFVAVLGPVVAALSPQTTGWWKVALVTVTSLLALVGFAIPAARSKINERKAADADDYAQEAGTAMRLAMADTLLPALSRVVSGLDPMSDKPATEVRAATVPMTLLSAARLCDSTRCRTRASWYALEHEGSDDRPVLVPRDHYGRGVQPSTRFSGAEPRGEALMNLMSTENTELWVDLDEEKPVNWKPTSNDTSYRSFMVVPVRTDRQVFGLIMLDADEPNVFKKADVYTVQVLASILALALSQERVATSTPVPTQAGAHAQ